MKQNFKNGIMMVLAVCMLSVSSCKDDAEEVKPIQEEIPPVAEVVCKMTSVTYDEESPITLEYNEQGNVSSLKMTASNSDGAFDVYTTTYIYDSKPQLVREESYTNGEMNEYTSYEYQDGLLTSAKNYEYIAGRAEGDLLTTKTYKYDADKRAVEITLTYPSTEDNYFGGISTTSKYTYDNKGNVEMVENYNDGTIVGKVVYSGYDDKPNPYPLAKGIIIIDEEAVSKNNPGKRAASYYIDNDGDGVMEDNGGSVKTYTYEYDSKGYPVKITEVYEDGSQVVTGFSFECK